MFLSILIIDYFILKKYKKTEKSFTILSYSKRLAAAGVS